MIEIPAYPIPMASRLSPFAAVADREVRDYLHQFGMLSSADAERHYVLSRFGDMVGRMYPDADRPDLILIGQWMAVWAMFDDQLEELPDHHDIAEWQFDTITRKVMSWLSPRAGGPSRIETPFGRAFADLWQRITDRTSLSWQRRFLGHFEEYLVACRWEAGHRKSGVVPDRASYVTARRRFGGARPALDLMEVGWRFELPEELHRDARMEAVITAGADLMLWANDLFSAECDSLHGNVSNIVIILSHEQRCSLQEAAAAVADLYKDRLRDFLALKRELPTAYQDFDLADTDRRNADQYADGPLVWTRGQHDWSIGNERYRSYLPRTSDGRHNALARVLHLQAR